MNEWICLLIILAYLSVGLFIVGLIGLNEMGGLCIPVVLFWPALIMTVLLLGPLYLCFAAGNMVREWLKRNKED